MLTHCFFAEWIWPLRIQGTNPTTLRDPADFADFNALRVQWDVARQKLADYISGLTEADLARVYTYRNTAGRNTRLQSVKHCAMFFCIRPNIAVRLPCAVPIGRTD